MFSNVVYVDGNEIFCRVLRSKTVFSEVNSGRNNLFRKLYLRLLNEHLIVFKCYFGTPIIRFGPLIGTLVSLEKRTYRFEVICGGTTFSEKCFNFRLSHRTLYCYQRWL